MSAKFTNTGSLRTVSLRVVVVLLLICVAVLVGAWRWQHNPEVTVGVEGQRIVEIPGPQLIAAPFTPGDALSVRIAGVQSTAVGFRYDLRYMAFGPGQHDIGKSLIDPNGQSPPTRPEFIVAVKPLIPEKHSGELYATRPSHINLHTNYSLLMTVAWVTWAVLLIPLICYGRSWQHRTAAAAPPASLIERLRALLRRAAMADLTPAQQADLEQLLLAFWSERLNLSEQRLSKAIQQLREHPQAGPQWTSVERWFHARATPPRRAAAQQLLADLEALALNQ